MYTPGEEIVQIVDEQNRELGELPRRLMREQRLIHRASYILVFNAAGALFIQKRTSTKDVYPGYWDVAAGGVVQAGETAIDVAAALAFQANSLPGIAVGLKGGIAAFTDLTGAGSPVTVDLSITPAGSISFDATADTLTLTGAVRPGDVYSVTVDGITYTYVAESGDAPLSLQVHAVQNLGLHFLFMQRTGFFQQPVGQRPDFIHQAEIGPIRANGFAAGRFLDADDVGDGRQSLHRVRQHVARGAARNVVEDLWDVDRLRHRAEVPIQAFLSRLVVVRNDRHVGRQSRIVHSARQLDRLERGV